ncbi:conserved hypothetical protein [Culex quinquefasciatus]|uniref:Uncharacterized protein n=1 Tax=Culex quinquefasciatus TaxID=7176 RepID=B0WGA2_CULQU|nr:conserved hypothetical protein [Culex quinquefasciatus]|eukprot:XP_001847736.1 conserved hypothetical protein [Culex quinquefasciatus]
MASTQLATSRTRFTRNEAKVGSVVHTNPTTIVNAEEFYAHLDVMENGTKLTELQALLNDLRNLKACRPLDHKTYTTLFIGLMVEWGGVIKAFIAVLSVIQFLGCLSLRESIPFDASHVKIQSELQVNRKTTLSVSGSIIQLYGKLTCFRDQYTSHVVDK